MEKRIRTILDPGSTLILNAKRKDSISTGAFARATKEEKKLILAELEFLR